MSAEMSSLITLSFTLGTALALCYLLYRSTIPTPIPGIPYSKSAIRPLGDALAASKYQTETDQAFGFMMNKCVELQSPIVQAFMEPFKKPWVIIADSVTIEDILVRRTKEFDISPWFAGIFEATVPGSHLHLQTNDQWKKQRRIMNDTMSSQFLHNVAGPKAHDMCMDMIELWNEKIRLGQGKPFSVATDVEDLLLDNIWALAFGSSIGATQSQKHFFTSLEELPQTDDQGISDLAVFPEAKRPAAFDTIVTITDSHMIPIRSLFGPLHHKLAFQLSPKLRRAARHKEAMITERIDAAWNKAPSAQVDCAADLLVQRERMFVEKEGRPPRHTSTAFRDELYTFLQAGTDTTSAAVQWALKLLTANKEAERRLRAALREEFGNDGLPSAIQISKTQIPYLEATIEESLRCGVPVGILARQTQVDCRILGHFVPAKTNVLLTSLGPGYRTPALDLPMTFQAGADAEKSVRPNNQFKGNWDPDSLSEFKPERWLHTDVDGRTRFSVRAGPSHAMGTGPRHCFGKPLAYLDIRVFLALIVMSFELLPLPAGLEEFGAKDRMTHRPTSVYLNLKKL